MTPGIIDFRFRPNLPEFLGAFIPPHGPIQPFKQYVERYRMAPRLKPTDLRELVEILKELGIYRAVTLASDTETKWGRKTSNEFVAGLVNDYPDFFVGFAGVDPYKGDEAVRELRRALGELGLVGVDLPPFLQQMYANDPRCFPIYETCIEFGVPIQIHTSFSFDPGVPMDLGHPKYIDAVAVRFPELTIVCNHAGYPWVREMITVAWRHPNVYIDISGAYPKYLDPELVRMINTPVLADKTVYGSSYFFLDFERCLEEIRQIGLKDDVFEKVTYHNAARLLGVE